MASEVSTTAAQQDLRRRLAELERELGEAHQREAATAELLQVINRPQFALQSAFDAIAQSAGRLCEAEFAFVFRFDGELLSAAASYGLTPEGVAAWRKAYPRPAGEDTAIGRAILLRSVVEIPDVQADPAYITYGRATALAQRMTYRSLMAVPFLRDGHPIGGIAVGRAQTGRFTESQIRLLQSFADQAVIAIENTRLFEAEQASKRELQESLEYQTAISEVISEVLGVISRSPTNVQPVFDTIARSALHLCAGTFSCVFRFDGRLIHFAAAHGTTPEGFEALRNTYPLPPGRASATTRAIETGAVAEITGVDADPDYEHRHIAGVQNFKSLASVPMLKDGLPIGTITVGQAKTGRFPPRQIALLRTFADQAVIAIENARLFEAEQESKRELQESLEYQSATSEVLQAISRTAFELQPIIDTLVETAARLCDAEAWLFRREGEIYRWAASYGFSPEQHERIKAHFKQQTFVPNRGMTSMRTALEGRPVHIVDVLADPEFTHHKAQELAGFRTTLGVPLLRDGVTIGVFSLTRREVQPFTNKQIELITTFADQAVIAIENARLFEEIARKSRDLEIASQHKSQFVANMSHELRTPLAAMLGYAELLQEGIYGAQPEKSLPILTRIRSNGKHLLGLINTVLDISKIEAGQFKLNLSEYALGSIVDTVMVATESLAATKKLAFRTEVAKGLPYGLGDEQRLTQVLLNLVGNAIKFTDAGEVCIAAGAANGHFTVSVRDTGPGIPTEECERIFEKFRQVDSSNTRAKGGTGLGLAIAREIVEMHGGRIWVESTLGQGSTFRMELPVRAAAADGAA